MARKKGTNNEGPCKIRTFRKKTNMSREQFVTEFNQFCDELGTPRLRKLHPMALLRYESQVNEPTALLCIDLAEFFSEKLHREIYVEDLFQAEITVGSDND